MLEYKCTLNGILFIQREEAYTSKASFIDGDQIEKQDVLRDKFSSYLQIGRNIPIGQSHVKDILSLCTNKDDFWRVIKCLLECNVIIYRSPITLYNSSEYSPTYFVKYIPSSHE
mgnify:CR=1 FL=1